MQGHARHGPIPLHSFAQPTFEVESFGNFSSVVANVALTRGRWYYECTVKKCSLTCPPAIPCRRVGRRNWTGGSWFCSP